MSLINRLFNRTKKDNDQSTKKDIIWKPLKLIEELEQIKINSHKKPAVLFKHSTRCGISTQAKFRLERAWDFSSDDLDLYYLDLLKYRPISNEIVNLFDVPHQSPQLILVQNGKATYHTSHNGINAIDLKEAIELS